MSTSYENILPKIPSIDGISSDDGIVINFKSSNEEKIISMPSIEEEIISTNLLDDEENIKTCPNDDIVTEEVNKPKTFKNRFIYYLTCGVKGSRDVAYHKPPNNDFVIERPPHDSKVVKERFEVTNSQHLADCLMYYFTCGRKGLYFKIIQHDKDVYYITSTGRVVEHFPAGYEEFLENYFQEKMCSSSSKRDKNGDHYPAGYEIFVGEYIDKRLCEPPTGHNGHYDIFLKEYQESSTSTNEKHSDGYEIFLQEYLIRKIFAFNTMIKMIKNDHHRKFLDIYADKKWNDIKLATQSVKNICTTTFLKEYCEKPDAPSIKEYIAKYIGDIINRTSSTEECPPDLATIENPPGYKMHIRECIQDHIAT